MLVKGASYRDRDYAFGQVMLTLRTKIGLTQTGLADFLGVSRRTVGDWEAGNKYPNAEHLSEFITLAIKHHAFRAGLEAQEAHALWHASHQKVLLDEAWLGRLLSGINPHPASKAEDGATGRLALTAKSRHVDWGDALAVPAFYGRKWELDLLTEWIVDERCRVVSVIGLGGIGKSALAVHLMHELAERFEAVIWRSLRDRPSWDALLDSLLQVVAPQGLSKVDASIDHRQSILLEYMRSHRSLLLLDNLESVMEAGESSGHLLPGYEGFGRFLRLSAETEHQSCVLLTSREKPIDLMAQEGNKSPVRALRLARLDLDSCELLLRDKDVMGTASERARLIEAYTGNPLALKIVAQTVIELFDGEIAPFLEQGELIYGGVRELLNAQFVRLSALEQSVLLWLAILREPATLDELETVLVSPVPRGQLLESVDALRRRSLIESGQQRGSFTLQSVVLEYVTMRLIEDATNEIEQGQMASLIEHGLELAHTREYVRQTQQRVIIAPILSNLHNAHLQRAPVEDELLALLDRLKTQSELAQGYGPANLVALLRLLHGDLRGLDLSRLALRNVNLQGVEMQDTTLAGAIIQDSVFTETFDVITAVAISHTGDYWAAASSRGEVWMWEAGGTLLRRAWWAHADMVWSLAFSPDGLTLASGSWDGTVKLWDLASGALLWKGQHPSHVNRVAFAPDGNILASSVNDATVRLWDPQTGTQLETLSHPAAVPAIAWSPDGRLLASGDVQGDIRLWRVQKPGPTTCEQILAGHSTWVDDVAFAPDGSTLASASWDGTIKLWEVASGHLRQTLAGHTDYVSRVVWSPDGRTLASSSRDQTIRLWDLAQGNYSAVLRGHTTGAKGLAFMPDNRSVLSGSGDGTLRVWNIASGQCTRVLHGYAASLDDVDWSPDGTQLVSGGTDELVTIYTITGPTMPRVLRGHGGLVLGVGWSPDGRWLASSEWDNAIRVWDPTSGVSVEVLRHPDDPGNYFYGLAWSPDGQRLAGGTYRRGVFVWDVRAHAQPWVGREFSTWIRHVAWRPDGAQLAGGGDDGTVYVWDAVDGSLLRRLAGHQSMVTRLAWSPDGTRLASGSSSTEGGELFVWDVQRGELVHSVAKHPGIVYAVAWGPNEDVLISGGGDGKLRWWDLQRGELLWVREAHQRKVESLRRSPDGSKLASCGDDGAIMLWDLNLGEHLQTLRRDRPYERLNITGVRGLTEVQKATLRALGAIEEPGDRE